MLRFGVLGLRVLRFRVLGCSCWQSCLGLGRVAAFSYPYYCLKVLKAGFREDFYKGLMCGLSGLGQDVTVAQWVFTTSRFQCNPSQL